MFPNAGRIAAVALAVAAGACATGTGIAPPSTLPPATTAPSTTTTTTTAPTTTTTTEPPRVCDPVTEQPTPIDIDDPVDAAIAIAEATFPCADEVTLTAVGDPRATAAAAHALAVGGPLLLVGADGIDETVVSELVRLEPERVTVAGMAGVDLDPIAGFVVERLGGVTDPAPGDGDVVSPAPARLWIVDRTSGALTEPLAVAAATVGDTMLLVDGADLRAMDPTQAAAVRTAGDAGVVPVGPITPDADWQLDVIRAGFELPGGGFLLFPHRRLVALYGHPGTPVLGVLGEQSPEAGIERLEPLLEEYAADGIPAIPTFEIIATIADAAAGSDGDYSAEISVDALRPWIEFAREAGAYVILDLQPGRTDFLTQARYYEEFLREPHVGLALDPEWRLEPDEFHLQQIGSVDAAEVDTVVAWLAGIVREEALPQKLLVLHQFRVDMITGRDTIELPPELAVLAHVDGQGALDLKYETWGVLTTQPGSDRLWWGWKNFYDEDPQLATPAEVLALQPTVYMVSFQ